MPIYETRLPLDAGADFSSVFIWSSGTPPTPVDYSGATARMMVRSTPNDAAPIISISSTPNDSGQINLGVVDGVATAGAVQIIITKLATSSFAVTTAGYDLFIDWPNGTSTEFLRGTVHVNLAFTH